MTQPLKTAGEVNVDGKELPIGIQPAMLEAMIASSPLGRLGSPEEAAGAVLFFCSPLSDYVTGEVLICGGGCYRF